MTSVSRSQSAEPTPSVSGTVDRRKLYRFAGWGAALGGVCYLLQPILVAVMEATSSGPENVFLSPTEIADVFWQGPVEGAVFTGVGIGLLAAVLGVGRLVRTGARDASPWWGVAHVLGIVAACGWLLLAGLSIGLYSSVARAMAEIGADEPTMRVALHMGSVVIAGVLALTAVASASWLIGLGRTGRRAGVIGLPAAVVALIAAAVCLVPMLALSQPFGVLATAPAFIVVGVSMLRRSR